MAQAKRLMVSKSSNNTIHFDFREINKLSLIANKKIWQEEAEKMSFRMTRVGAELYLSNIKSLLGNGATQDGKRLAPNAAFWRKKKREKGGGANPLLDSGKLLRSFRIVESKEGDRIVHAVGIDPSATYSSGGSSGGSSRVPVWVVAARLESGWIRKVPRGPSVAGKKITGTRAKFLSEFNIKLKPDKILVVPPRPFRQVAFDSAKKALIASLPQFNQRMINNVKARIEKEGRVK